MKQNDTNPPYSIFLTETINGVIAPVDLTGCTAQFVMINRLGETVKVNQPADILSPTTSGQVQYQWVSGDTDTVGSYKIVIHITYASGKVRTFPDTGYDSIDIEKNYP